MRRVLTLLALVAVLLSPASLTRESHPTRTVAAQADPLCSTVPLGALPGQPAPIWCYTLAPDDPTFQSGTNAWIDNFNHGATLAQLGTGYVQGVRGGGRGLHWRHADHWMVDLHSQSGQYPTLLAAFMRPDRTFRPIDGKLVIEFDVAVPIAGTRNANGISDSWPELVITTAPEPTTTNPWGSWLRQNGTYLYEGFPHAWAFGCRMQQSRHPICALYRPNAPGTPNYAGGPDRLWEINQNGGDVTDEYGGDPTVAGLDAAWATCSSAQDPDTTCRNAFRWELQANRVKLFVKRPGATQWVRYYEAGLIDSNLGNVLNAPNGVHVFFGDFAYRIENNVVLRFHWDRLAVNPDAMGVPPPTNTPTATPTATLAPATPTPTATPTLVCVAHYYLNGQDTGLRRAATLADCGR